MIPTPDFAITSQRVITAQGERAAAILIHGEKILDIISISEIPSDCPVEDMANDVVMPGLVDTHVHINEPGRTDWEGFETATKAAAAGGITTLVDMPLNCIPVTTTVDALHQKIEATKINFGSTVDFMAVSFQIIFKISNRWPMRVCWDLKHF